MFDIQEELKKLPEKPGVYIMRDKNDQIIYVGKAVVLKNRVRQYFQQSNNHTPKVTLMVTKIVAFETIVTDSELEALILECNLIKEYRPKYNVLLKDDKHYPYIKVTMNEDFPRIFMTRRMEKDGGKYFGPYSNTLAVRETIELLKRLFPVKTCKKEFPRDLGKARPCLNYYIHQCLGPCQGNVNKEDYRALMKDICSFLGGRVDEVIKRMEMLMQTASRNLEFEKAASLRDKIASIRHIAQKQKVYSMSDQDQDVIAIASDDTDSLVQIFFIRGGKLTGKEHFIMEGTLNLQQSEILLSFLKQYYNTCAFVPSEIILSTAVEEQDVLEKWLSQKREGKVILKDPKKGDKLEMVKMVERNASLALLNHREKANREGMQRGEGLGLLVEALHLENYPARIEAYDISNTGTSEVVGSMVVFENGKPNPAEYRRFKIRSITDKPNDYLCMQEVIFRRITHAKREIEEQRTAGADAVAGKFTRLPDMILLDGGLGHIHSVKEIMNQLSCDIPVYGMVKDDKHRTRGIMTETTEIELSKNLPLLRFVTWVQDEVHRYAIEYHRKLRSKKLQKSILDEIDGIGPKRKKALIKKFGSAAKVKMAQIEELAQTEGIGMDLAVQIKKQLDSK